VTGIEAGDAVSFSVNIVVGLVIIVEVVKVKTGFLIVLVKLLYAPLI